MSGPRLAHSERFELTQARRAAIWEHMEAASAQDSEKEEVLEVVRDLLDRYWQAPAKREKMKGRVPPAVRRANALKISDAIRRLRQSVEQSDIPARSRLYISLAEVNGMKRGKKARGKILYKRMVKNLGKAARAAVGVAQKHVKPGRPSKNAELKMLFCVLADLWEAHTGQRFAATEIRSKRYASQLNFIEAVLVSGAITKPASKSFLNLLKVGRKFAKRHGKLYVQPYKITAGLDAR